MNRMVRRGVLGGLASAVAGIPLLGIGPVPIVTYTFGIAAGIIYSILIPPRQGAYIDNAMAAGSFGIPLWGITDALLFPLFSGHVIQTGFAGMTEQFPSLFVWVRFGVLLGLLLQLFNDGAQWIWGSEISGEADLQIIPKQILILGGGFAGMKTAEELERVFGGDPSVAITLVSETNALLFTPMLAEVAGSSLEPSDISPPLRTCLRCTNVVRGSVSSIDMESRTVVLDGAKNNSKSTSYVLHYDQLVFALGAVSNYLGMANVKTFAFDFKSLLDAIRIRNHVIEMFERADTETDSEARRRLLTFVIAGGGFAGVELAGALNDFCHSILADYRNLTGDELQVILVHSRDRILPELSERLAHYALDKMKERGVIFRLNARLTDAAAGTVVLGEEKISAETLVWTAGTAPSPLLKELPLDTDRRGAVVVDTTLAVPRHPGVWALGDCASVTDGKTSKSSPPTAQFAIREAAVLANNIRAVLAGQKPKPFHFDSLGSLCVIGHQTACAELTVPFARSRSVRFSGLLAWGMWRGIYLMKLPGLERKLRVLIAWTLELFFPRDIVQTIDLSERQNG